MKISNFKKIIQASLVNYDNLISNYQTILYYFVNIDETRRSTRKRKLKYENYSYSSIARSQGLKGYPDMVDEEDYSKLSSICYLVFL